MAQIIDRRRFLAGTAGAAGLLAAPSVLRAQGAKELVIVSFAGQLQEPHQWLARRMEARHPGLKITLVPSESQDIVAQIKAAQGFSPYDAMPNGEPPHLIAIRDGYIQKLDPAKVPNAAKVFPEFMAKSGGYGVPASYSTIGIAYNEKPLKTPPKSWTDLWNPEYRGKVGIPRAASNLGLGVLVVAAKVFGGSEDNLEPGWSKLQELKPIVGRSPTQLLQMLEREEIAIAPIWNNDAAGGAAKGLPIKFVQPEPGPVAIISFMAAIAKTREPDLVNEWMNDILSPEYQAMAANAPYFFGPTVQGVAVPDAAKPYTPSTPAEVLKLQSVDWSKIAPVRGKIVEQFDRLFAQLMTLHSSSRDVPPMLRDVARQAEVLSGLLGRADAFLAAGAGLLRPGPGGRLFVFGCGDGLFAAAAARRFAEDAGLDWRPLGALDAVLGAARMRPEDRAIAISMSGNVDRTVEAARAVEAAGVPLLALVNGGGGRLGEIAARKVSLDLPDIAPFLCGTASYTATLAA